MTTLAPLELAGRLALAIGLAVFMGLAFEEVYKSEERSSPGGVRTFPMLTMSGATLYLIEPAHALAFVAGLLALAAWLHAYLRAAPREPEAPSFMIPASNLLAYVIGPIAVMEPPWVAVALTVTAVLLLGTRERLHSLIHVVPRDELLTAGEFLILVGIVLPLVPNTRVTSLTPLTPFGVWLAVVTICSLSYLSYLLQRYGHFRGNALLSAVLGGAYSSTATTVVLAKRLRGTARRNPISRPASSRRPRSCMCGSASSLRFSIPNSPWRWRRRSLRFARSALRSRSSNGGAPPNDRPTAILPSCRKTRCRFRRRPFSPSSLWSSR